MTELRVLPEVPLNGAEVDRGFLDASIEVSWLVALAFVPLVFSNHDIVVFFAQPKDFILHLVALLILALWGFAWALGTYRTEINFRSISAIRNWPGRDPRNCALLTAAGFAVSAVLSTLLSPYSFVSVT